MSTACAKSLNVTSLCSGMLFSLSVNLLISQLKGLVIGPKNKIGPLINFANLTGICVARIFGKTSPNNTRINVTRTVFTINSRIGLFSNEKKCPNRIDDIKTIKILIQLLACRIVPKR